MLNCDFSLFLLFFHEIYSGRLFVFHRNPSFMNH